MHNYQTPIPVAKYMTSLIPIGSKNILEPTAGEGNIVSLLSNFQVTSPDNFFDMAHNKFDCVVMNPPFSKKYAFGVPEHLNLNGLQVGYYILKSCMGMSDSVIALMPWTTLSDSDYRLRELKEFGLKSITALPRATFRYVRIQTCVLELSLGYNLPTEFKVFNF